MRGTAECSDTMLVTTCAAALQVTSSRKHIWKALEVNSCSDFLLDSQPVIKWFEISLSYATCQRRVDTNVDANHPLGWTLCRVCVVHENRKILYMEKSARATRVPVPGSASSSGQDSHVGASIPELEIINHQGAKAGQRTHNFSL